MDKKKAIIIEDFKLIAELWETLLSDKNIETIKSYNNADGIESEILALDPDIILMDINLKGKMNGIQLTAELIKSKPEIRVLVLTIHKDKNYILKAKKAGARGYLTKNSSVADFNTAIDTVLNDEFYFDLISAN